MKQFINNLFITALVMFILLFFVSTIWQEPFVFELISAMGLVMLVSIFIVFPKRALILPIILIMLSISIISLTSSSPVVLWKGLREMSVIIPLVILINLVSWIIGHRPYVKALMNHGKKQITTPIRFFSLVAALSHFISSFMAVGGVAFVYQMFRDTKKQSVSQESWDFILSAAVMRGFTLTVLWTVVHPAFAYGIAGTNAPLLPTVLKGLGLACIGFVISIIIFMIEMKRKQISASVISDLSVRPEDKLDGLVWRFLFWVSLLMGGILISNQWLHLDILLAVPIVIVTVTTLYFISNKSMSEYKQLWVRLVTVDLDKKKKEMSVILSAGLLVATLKETGYDQLLFGYFLHAVDVLNLNILIGLTFVVILLGFCGLPPIPAMVLLSGILVDIPGGYSADLVLLSLLLGVAVTLVIAPVTVPLLLISSQNGLSLGENGFRSNILFAVSLLIVGLIYIQVLTLF
ncbi:hypothetical protein [Halalkalibacter nanhaiisediminis]|uniref:Uncharacterized protein n=1 Tax=Halalkalibacter nanhaiisediminis TaxID=688079 RepID=A0A562QNE9_9BACI|nr:hypothetical protein [Halalkalibacter nanhaiisediminis]TWI58193.1 hypothetical protein IQ10_01527 [Halalkalibacter nanhaiisediminis]